MSPCKLLNIDIKVMSREAATQILWTEIFWTENNSYKCFYVTFEVLIPYFVMLRSGVSEKKVSE